MHFGLVLSGLFLGIWCVMLASDHATLSQLLLTNGLVQITLFALVACLPFLRTGRMSYVDIAWPFGVALIGVQILLFADGEVVRRAIVGCIYLFIGLRMGIGALVMARTTGVIIRSEFPRYQYRRLMMEQDGTAYPRVHMFAEILAQGLANASVLALPGMLMAVNTSTQLSAWEVMALVLWVAAYSVESIADTQKLLFIKQQPGAVCNVGLWRYSRHPNYFSEWLVWTSLVLAAVPSWLALQSSLAMPVWWVAGIGALGASIMLYITLVYLTGAKPAEYYSVRKRPGYRAYQASTSMFFPWFPKAGASQGDEAVSP